MRTRLILAERLSDGMKRAWESTIREPVTAEDVAWNVEPVDLPPAKYLLNLKTEMKMTDTVLLRDNAEHLAWLQRYQAGKRFDLACLSLGRARILHLPGEPFVEYQLAAKAMRPDLFLALAACGDLAPWYIGTAIAYQQGGYEAGPASGVAPEAEQILLTVIRKLLNTKQ